MNKNIKTGSGILFVFLLLISAMGCVESDGEYKEVSGSKGLEINFLKGIPQGNYLVGEGTEPIDVIVEVENKGAFPQEEDLVKWIGLKKVNVKLSGFDTNIISSMPSIDTLEWENLPGASYFNPEGGFDTAEFSGNIVASRIKVDKYEPNILAAIYYPYSTKASPAVCIDPSPYDEQKKVCEIGTRKLTSQGAPIAIIKIEQEASTRKMQFKIHIKNIGDGDVINLNSLEKCSSGALEKDDFDRVELTSIKVGSTDLLSSCTPFVEDNLIQLYNRQAFVVCSLDISTLTVESAYTTPLTIELRYGYRSTTSKNIKITKTIIKNNN